MDIAAIRPGDILGARWRGISLIDGNATIISLAQVVAIEPEKNLVRVNWEDGRYGWWPISVFCKHMVAHEDSHFYELSKADF
jgi:hypothetical protein